MSEPRWNVIKVIGCECSWIIGHALLFVRPGSVTVLLVILVGPPVSSVAEGLCVDTISFAAFQGCMTQPASAQRADERRRSAQHVGVRSIGWLGSALLISSFMFIAW